MNAPVLSVASRLEAGSPAAPAMSARTLVLLNGPIAPTLLRLACIGLILSGIIGLKITS